MKMYQSPSMKFEELAIFEKIASDCWANQSFSFDNPYTHNCIEDKDISVKVNNQKCKASSTVKVLKQVDRYLNDWEMIWYSAYVLKSHNATNTNLKGFTLQGS